MEKNTPQNEPTIAKKLLQALAFLLFLCTNKEPTAPTPKKESNVKKLIDDVIISNILFFL